MKLNSIVFSKWIDWAEKIKSDLMEIVNNQQIYKQFEEVVTSNWDHIATHDGQAFCKFVKDCYGIQGAVGIRRHIKIDNDSISLMKLLDQLKNCAKQFSYEFYLTRYPIEQDRFEWQKSTFRNFSKDGNIVSENIITGDIQELDDIGGKVSDFVDRSMAHMDKRGPRENVTYGDLMKSIDLFNRITCKYLSLITSHAYVTLKPTIHVNWQKIFSVPFDVRRK